MDARLAYASVMVGLLAAGCRTGASNVEPSIEFSTVPPAATSGPTRLEPVAGRVKGARANQQIVLFAKSSVWWVQPFRSRPFTSIEPDSSWKSTIHLGTEYAALLVDADYRPPVTTESLPQPGGGVVAVARVAGSGAFVPPPPKTLTFSGYDWDIRRGSDERFGSNDYDARNASVDDDGHLHLILTERDGRWTSAEVRLIRSLGYGTYSFDVRDTSQLDPAAAFSMFTWAEAADHNREMKIDISRWGDPLNKNAQYAIQPEHVATNFFRFAVPSARLTHSLRWEPGRAAFKTVRTTASARGTALVAEQQFTAGVPVPGGEHPHFALGYVRASPSPPGKEVEVVVEKFVYLP